VSYYDRWLLPKLGLNEGTNFDGRPVGNHPEHMPWDCSLNKDVDDCVAYHVTITADKDFKDDPDADSSGTDARAGSGSDVDSGDQSTMWSCLVGVAGGFSSSTLACTGDGSSKIGERSCHRQPVPPCAT
jgi:hypothetical protein